MGPDPENQLVHRLRAGEHQAFRQLVEQYKAQIYRLALDLTDNHHDAEDLSQEAFLKAFRGMRRFRAQSSLTTWLYRITVNLNIDKRRRKSATAEQLRADLDEVEETRTGDLSPEINMEQHFLQKRIDQALQALSERERKVFVLRHYHDQTIREIAELLRVAEGTVKTLLYRAIKKLQSNMADYRSSLEA